jgi:hypothetical protein
MRALRLDKVVVHGASWSGAPDTVTAKVLDETPVPMAFTAWMR